MSNNWIDACNFHILRAHLLNCSTDCAFNKPTIDNS